MHYLDKLFGLANQRALVIGGSGRLGGAMALALGRSGSQVWITGRTVEKAQAKVDSLLSETVDLKLQADACEVTDLASLSALRARMTVERDSLDTLIVAAGGNDKAATVQPSSTLEDIDLEGARKLFDSNYWGVLYAVKTFVPMLRKSSNPSIITVGSMAGDTPLSKVIAYSSAKAALHNLTQFLAGHYARQGSHIRVNSIAPGFFLAEQSRHVLDEARKQAIVSHTPMGRFGEPEDLEGITVYLASHASKFTTGTIIPIDGGFSSSTI